MDGISVSERTQRIATLSVIAIFGLLYVMVALRMPDGFWDSWAIWNLRAKFLAFAPDVRAAFDPALAYYSHLDYPILLPTVIALIWNITGFTVWVPIVVHGAIFITMLWLLRHSWIAVIIAGCSCLSFAAFQMADLPLAVCLLGAVIAYTQKRETLTGVLLGMAIHIKNEGALMLLAFFVVWVVMERRLPWRAMAAALPFVVLLIAFKMWVGQSNDVVSAGVDFAKMISRERFGIIRSYAIPHIAQFGSGGLALLVVYAWAMRARMRFTVPLAAITLVFLGYIGIYMNTPQDLLWHLDTSFDRLVLQLFPTLVFEVTRQAGAQEVVTEAAPATSVLVGGENRAEAVL